MKYQPPFNNGGDPDASWINGNPSTGTQGSIPSAAAFEQPLRELHALIAKSGLTPSDADLTQLAQAIRSQALNYRVAGGTANALTVTLDPPLTAHVAGMPLRVITASSPTGAATIAIDGLPAVPITAPGNTPVKAGDWLAGQVLNLVCIGGTRYELANMPSQTPVPTGSVTFKTPGTTNWTVPAGVSRVRVRIWGGGGGGGGSYGTNSAGSGGGGGAYGELTGVAVTPGSVIAVTVGAGGTAGSNASAPTNGGVGGSSSFGSHLTVNGGGGGAGGLNGIQTSASGSGGSGSGTAHVAVAGGQGGVPWASGGGAISGGAGGYAGLGGGVTPPNIGVSGTPATGINGIAPGGGASGGAWAGPGGVGAAGMVIIDY